MGKKKHSFTPEMDKEIRRIYQEHVGMKASSQGYHPVKDLAAKFGMPRYTISNRATLLGVHARQKKEPDWFDKEKSILTNHAHLSAERIRKKLKEKGFKRSLTGIIIKRKRMHLLKNLKGQSAASLAECFGVDNSTVAYWIRKGWLKAKKRGTNRKPQQGGDMYFIKERQVRRFIIEYLSLIDFRKIDKYWLVDLLAGGKNGLGPLALKIDSQDTDEREYENKMVEVESDIAAEVLEIFSDNTIRQIQRQGMEV